MGKEIERKFLVADTVGATAKACKSYQISQGYLSADPDRTVRVRVRDNQAFLTIKSRNRGAERGEWEYEVPATDGRELLKLCTKLIEKTRYLVEYAGHTWEVDEFHGRLEGLWLAEVELPAVDAPVELPPWAGREITADPQYYNSNLAGGNKFL